MHLISVALMEHSFGGDWTEQKLAVVEKYLRAWLKIFHSNPRANWYEKIYVDAFAGTGFRTEDSDAEDEDLFPDVQAPEKRLLTGSCIRALNIDPGFDQYILVEKNRARAAALRDHVSDFVKNGKNVQVRNKDANLFLESWECDWKKSRCVMFIDPYGMQLNWRSLEKIAATNAVDLWLLFPTGQAVNRLLTRNDPPPGFVKRLNAFFGTGEWKEAFYRVQPGLFSGEFAEKSADFDSITNYFVERLKSLSFTVTKPGSLRRPTGHLVYHLFFACANPQPQAYQAAIRIANDIIRKI